MWDGVRGDSSMAVTTNVRSDFEEGEACALRSEMCRFGGRVEFLRIVEEAKMNSDTKD